ncbi:hypothetical protein RHGRI_007911 [Rhododendron griersonianum]|uniref:Uncharacterized protein n=1 Tax=Rhododendron griersonianum TaxID=479676 RepID=A0AAV6KYU7_9ERIC|nr:hypothetical protein RHGRI_007911 [Rhododendron griersonianum]
MTCVYEPTTAAARRVLWQELEAIGRGEDLDWIVGDFNAIAHQDEKFGVYLDIIGRWLISRISFKRVV